MKKTFLFSAFATVAIIVAVIGIRYSTVYLPQPNDEEALRLGATLPMTGLAATYGDAIREGINLAVSDLAAEGIRTRVSVEDVSVPGPMAVTAIRSLIADKKIEALVANFYNPNIPIMAPAIMNAKILAFHTAEADDKILDAGDYIFSTNAKIKDESAQMAELSIKSLKARTAAVLYLGTTFGEHYNKHFTRSFEQLGGKVIYSEFTALGDNDVRTMVVKALAEKPDVIVVASFGPTLGILLKTLNEFNAKQPIVSVYEAEDPSVLETAKTVRNRQVYFYSPAPAPNAVAAARFRDAFFKRYGHEPRLFSANAYDATILAARALVKCRRDRVCAQQYVAETRAFDGASGTFSIDADGAATKNFVLKTIVDGRFVAINQDEIKF